MSKIISMLEKMGVVEKDGMELPQQDKKGGSNIERAMEEKTTAEIKKGINEVDIQEKKELDSPNQKSNYERNLSIDEIYFLNDLKNGANNTIFMLGNFIDALPEYLPHDVKKKSVMNIVEASNTNLEDLLTDGEKRLNILNQFTREYGEATNTAINKNREEITKLRKLIRDYEENIRLREAMLEEQNNIIKYETQRMDNIIDFFRKGEINS